MNLFENKKLSSHEMKVITGGSEGTCGYAMFIDLGDGPEFVSSNCDVDMASAKDGALEVAMLGGDISGKWCCDSCGSISGYCGESITMV